MIFTGCDLYFLYEDEMGTEQELRWSDAIIATQDELDSQQLPYPLLSLKESQLPQLVVISMGVLHQDYSLLNEDAHRRVMKRSNYLLENIATIDGMNHSLISANEWASIADEIGTPDRESIEDALEADTHRFPPVVVYDDDEVFEDAIALDF